MRVSSSFSWQRQENYLPAQKIEEAQRIESDHNACADLQVKKRAERRNGVNPGFGCLGSKSNNNNQLTRCL